MTFGWFVRSSPREIIESDTIIGNYLLLSIGPEEKPAFLEPLETDTKSWVGFWKVPSNSPYFGLKPSGVGDNVRRLKYPSR